MSIPPHCLNDRGTPDRHRVLDLDMSARRWLVAAILAVCLGGPIAESFDWWDQSQPAGDDTETNLVVVALSVGLAVSVAAIIVQWFQSFVAGLSSQRLVTHSSRVSAAPSARLSSSGNSPPPLRI